MTHAVVYIVHTLCGAALLQRPFCTLHSACCKAQVHVKRKDGQGLLSEAVYADLNSLVLVLWSVQGASHP